jgi:hypothetical protein
MIVVIKRIMQNIQMGYLLLIIKTGNIGKACPKPFIN